jgi:hypothetical protein
MKYQSFQQFIDTVKATPHKTLSTKLSRKAITYSVDVAGERIYFRVSRKLAQLQEVTNDTSSVQE